MNHKRKFEVEKSRFPDRWWCLSNPRVHVCYWIYLLFLLHFNQVSITICSAEWTCLYEAEVMLCIHGKHYKSDLNGIIFVSSHIFLVLIQAVTFFLKIIGFSEQNFILIIFESIQIFWRIRFTWLHIGQILFLTQTNIEKTAWSHSNTLFRKYHIW